jgi:tetratricopeptide (TPR) repeat protein
MRVSKVRGGTSVVHLLIGFLERMAPGRHATSAWQKCHFKKSSTKYAVATSPNDCHYQHPVQYKEFAVADSGPDCAADFFVRGSTLQEEGQWAEAMEAFRATVALDPEMVGAWFALGYAAEQALGLPEAACCSIAAYRQVLRIDCMDAVAHYNLGVLLHYHTTDHDGAEVAYRAAIAASPAHASAYLNLGNLLKNHRRDFDGAEAAYRAAIESDQTYAVAHYNLGNLLQTQRKNHDAAEASYRMAVKCDPHYAAAHSNLGNLLQTQRKDFPGAAAAFRAAIAANPNYAAAHCNLGALYAVTNKRENFGAAEAAYRAAIEADPKYADAHHNLAVLLAFQLGDPIGAEVEYLAALKIDPARNATRYWLASLLGGALGRWADAAQHMRIAADRGHADAERKVAEYEELAAQSY